VVLAEDVAISWKDSVYYPLQAEQALFNGVIHSKTSVWQATLAEIIRTNQRERSLNLTRLAPMLGATVNRIIDGSNADPSQLFDGIVPDALVRPLFRRFSERLSGEGE